MNMWKRFSALRNGAPATSVAALCLGMALAGATSAFAQQDQIYAADRAAVDAQTESNVIVAISNSAALKGQQIAAGTADGQVTLTGAVNDAASKELAETIVQRVGGVRSVVNNLTVTSEPQAVPDQGQNQAQDQNVQAADDQGPDPALQNLAPGDQNQQAQNQLPMPDQNQQGPPPQGPNQAQNGNAPYPYPSGPAPRPDDDQAGDPNQPGMNQGPGQSGNPGGNQGYPQYPQTNQPPRGPYNGSGGQYGGRYGDQSGYYANQNSGPVTLPASTIVRVRTLDLLDARKLTPGTAVQFTAANDVFVGGVLAIPRGAAISGVVDSVRGSTSGSLAGSNYLTLKLTSLNLDNQSYPLASDIWDSKAPGKGFFTTNNTIGGAAFGALIGGIIGRGTGAAVGAVAGGATGAVASSAAGGPRMVIPAESVLTFHLTQPVTVKPISAQEAQRLASTQPQGGPPALRQRGYYPAYPPPPPPPGYYYGPGYYPYGGVVYGPR